VKRSRFSGNSLYEEETEPIKIVEKTMKEVFDQKLLNIVLSDEDERDKVKSKANRMPIYRG
jgi:Trp operon repressor